MVASIESIVRMYTGYDVVLITHDSKGYYFFKTDENKIVSNIFVSKSDLEFMKKVF
jgi:hypothetical protein